MELKSRSSAAGGRSSGLVEDGDSHRNVDEGPEELYEVLVGEHRTLNMAMQVFAFNLCASNRFERCSTVRIKSKQALAGLRHTPCYTLPEG